MQPPARLRSIATLLAASLLAIGCNRSKPEAVPAVSEIDTSALQEVALEFGEETATGFFALDYDGQWPRLDYGTILDTLMKMPLGTSISLVGWDSQDDERLDGLEDPRDVAKLFEPNAVVAENRLSLLLGKSRNIDLRDSTGTDKVSEREWKHQGRTVSLVSEAFDEGLYYLYLTTR